MSRTMVNQQLRSQLQTLTWKDMEISFHVKDCVRKLQLRVKLCPCPYCYGKTSMAQKHVNVNFVHKDKNITLPRIS